MKYTITEFANEIRKIYPDDYNDLSDNKLVELWLKKYPKDIDKVAIDIISHVETSKVAVTNISQREKRNIVYNQQPSSAPSSVGKVLFFGILLVGIVSATVYFLNNSSSRPREFIDDFQSSNFETGEKIKNQVVSTFKSNPFDNIQILDEINKSVDENTVLLNLNISEDTKIKIKKILSDLNPDPENKIGTDCGNQEGKCKFCTNIYFVPKTIMESQKDLNDYQFNPFDLVLLSYGGELHKKWIEQGLEHIVEEFKKGQKREW